MSKILITDIICIMKLSAYHILRISMAITFLWIGVLILQQPEAWGGYLQPWAADLLPISLKLAMILAGVMDILVGVFLLINVWVWHAAILGALHLALILVVSGINAITVRDIGLLGGAFALAFHAWPDNLRFWIKQNNRL